MGIGDGGNTRVGTRTLLPSNFLSTHLPDLAGCSRVPFGHRFLVFLIPFKLRDFFDRLRDLFGVRELFEEEEGNTRVASRPFLPIKLLSVHLPVFGGCRLVPFGHFLRFFKDEDFEF